MRDSTVRGPAIDLSEFERRLREAEPVAKSSADPLSELARLVNVGEAAAPAARYDQVFSPQVAATRDDLAGWLDQSGHAQTVGLKKKSVGPTPNVDEQAFAMALRGSLNIDGRDDSHDGYARRPAPQEDYPPHAESAFDGHHQAESAGDWHDDQRYLDYGADAPDEEIDDQKLRGGRMAGLLSKFRPWQAVLGVAVVGAASIGWGFAYRGGSTGPREIATINAPDGPSKVQPTADSGEAAAGQGATVLDRSENTPVKNVVTHEEQAMDPKVVPQAVKLGSGPVDAPHERPLVDAQPIKVKTVSVRPDGTIIENEPVPPAVAKATSVGTPKPVEKNGGTPKSVVKPATTPAAEKTAQAKPKPTPKPPAKPAIKEVADAGAGAEAEAAPADAPPAAGPVATGGFAVQFGAAGSEAEARALILKIVSKYGSQLGGHKPSFKMAKVADKTVYRVRVGGVSKESAGAICGKVKSSGGNCFVAGN